MRQFACLIVNPVTVSSLADYGSDLRLNVNPDLKLTPVV